MIVFVVSALLVAASAAALEAARRAALARRETRMLRARLERFELQLPRTETPRSVNVTSLRRDAAGAYVAREADRLRNVMAHLLADCRDAMGAEEAVLWRWNDTADALRPEDWSTEGARPAFFDANAWGSLVAHAMEEESLQLIGESGTVFAVAAPLIFEPDTTPVGVLSVTSRRGLSRSRKELEHWMPRLALQVAYARDLLQARLDYGRYLRQSHVILKAVERLGSSPSGDALARSLCETAVEVSGARGAALVRWNDDLETGDLHYATPGLGLRTPAPLDPESQVAAQCRQGLAQVYEDARGRSTAHALYGVGRSMSDPGSLAVLPIKRQGRVLGALVLESDEVNYFSPELSDPLSMLLAAAAGSLELAWSFGEVERRSRTDALTGLFNRTVFGEQLQEKLNLADRYEQPVSLVMVDIDHFKRVNDTYGHEAGDAVLRRVAGLIQEAVRSTDVCVRYGGEELALVLAQTDRRAAMDMAQRLCDRIAETVAFHKGATIPVTASFGVATYPETVRERDKLFPEADQALYRAKADGRNCVRCAGSSVEKATS